MKVGVNLNGIFDSDPALMFADVMMSARNWGSTGNPADEAATVDANGWPTGDAGIYLLSVSGSAYPSTYGTYQMTWQSTANPTITVNAGGVNWAVSGQAWAGGSGSATVTASTGALGILALVFTGTSGGIRNLKLMRPISPGSATSHATSETFTRQWISALAPFDVLRTMDLTITNNSKVTTWAQRTSPTWATHKGPKLSGLETGMPWEDACSIASATGKDLWINVPAQADDTYISSLATLLKANLPAATNVYVEYGNENWNNQFTQPQVVYDRAAGCYANAWQASHAYTTASQVSTVAAAQAMYVINGGNAYKCTTGGTSAASGGPTGTGTAIADGTAVWSYVYTPLDNPTGGATVLNYDGETNAFYMGNRYTAKRIKEISTSFSAVFGASAINTRIRCVLEGQGAGAPMLQGLVFLAGKYGAPSQWLYGAGAAQYFAESGSTSGDATATATRIIEEYKASLPQLASDQKLISAAAHNYGLKVTMYEGGPASAGATSLAAKQSANDDTRIQQIIWDWLTFQRDNGADVICQYQFISSWGSSGLWGLTDDVYNLARNKYIAMAQWKNREYQRAKFPTLTLTGISAVWVSGTTFPSGNTLFSNGVDAKMRWRVHVPGSGPYKIVYTYTNATAGALATVNVNGNTVFTGALPDSSGSNVTLPFNQSAGFNNANVVMLTAGDNTIEYLAGDAHQVGTVSIAISDQ